MYVEKQQICTPIDDNAHNYLVFSGVKICQRERKVGLKGGRETCGNNTLQEENGWGRPD